MFAAMRILRTPEERFSELSEFAYHPEYCEIDDDEGGLLRVAWVEHGPAHADPVLMLHGEPSWSFLYRRMIPIVAAAGYRVVCPDLVGFGRSDKPAAIADHTCYDAPFPDDSYGAGPRAMPGLVPTSPDDPATAANRSAWQVLRESATPMLVAFSDGDPITGAMGPIFRNEMPGAKGRDHPVIHDAGHFLQEDAGEDLAEAIVRFLELTDVSACGAESGRRRDDRDEARGVRMYSGERTVRGVLRG
jgi:pimeloyl-ACP methyl ester carboxylesterase